MSLIFHSLEPFRQQTEELIREAISRFKGPKRLVEACAYALCGEGKRIRPSIVLMIGGKQGAPAALCVEFLHTASLIADDLPCMDNDAMRRNRPSLHIAFDEETALLASYALIAEGYESLSQMEHPASCQRALLEISLALGLQGVTGGQYIDINLDVPDKENFLELIDRKTGALFESAFVLGWLSRSSDQQQIIEVKQAARSFGRIFQLSDDLDDAESDQKKGAPNGCTFFGRKWVEEKIAEELTLFRRLAQELGFSHLLH
ncbi:MAG: polyprenyl synthetase family protein [Verrucomicrobia bacterium]|nr:polyprenyl synthetase family protein [Verrucomicrobiota bacterium]